MEKLAELASLLHERNLLERKITAIINRPASIGHLGEYIASVIFQIDLEKSAVQKSIDGRFNRGLLAGRTVNVKWYGKQEGLLDLTPNALPDYYLVLTGPKSIAMSSRGQTRSWVIEHVYLFDALALVEEIKITGVLRGAATSVKQQLWVKAEIYPLQTNPVLELSSEQRNALALFKSRPLEQE